MFAQHRFHNHVGRDDFAVGIAVGEGIAVEKTPEVLESRLQELLSERRRDLHDDEEQVRKKARDLLRNGSYKPSGRSKPASEYLIRAAKEGSFPRINAAVDTINYLSLRHLVPISVWDLDLAGTDEYVFRLGGEQDSYVFNHAGQKIEICDLIAGFAVIDGEERPIVSPVKDSLATKTTDNTSRVAMAVYYPLSAGGKEHLRAILEEFAGIVAGIVSQPVEWQVVETSQNAQANMD